MGGEYGASFGKAGHGAASFLERHDGGAMGDGEAIDFLHTSDTAPVIHVVRDGAARAKDDGTV